MGKKHITAQRVEEPHGVSVCCVCLSACVCGRWGRYALNSSAERRETQEPVNNSSNSILFLHDCSPALPSSTSEYNSRMWRRTCQKLLLRNKVWPVHFRCVHMFMCLCVCERTRVYMCTYMVLCVPQLTLKDRFTFEVCRKENTDEGLLQLFLLST